jgi:hypothetical protein
MSTDAGGEPAAPPPAFSAGRIDAANGILTLSWGLESVRGEDTPRWSISFTGAPRSAPR